MDESQNYKIIKALIELVDDLPVGCEALEGYVETEDVWETWEKFKGQY